MKKIILSCFCALAVVSVWAKEPIKQIKPAQPVANQMQCNNPNVLVLLAQSFQSINKLPANVGYDFDDVRTEIAATNHSVLQGAGFYLRCEAKLRLINNDTKQLIDTVHLAYQAKDDAQGSYYVEFQPKQ